MSISTVRTHFLDRVKAQLGDMRILAEGENFTPKGLQDFPMARFSVLPRESTTLDIGTNPVHREAGLVNVTLYFSRARNSVDEALAQAEELAKEFSPQDLAIDESNQLLIFTPAWVEAVRHEDNTFGVPVFIRWVNLARNP